MNVRFELPALDGQLQRPATIANRVYGAVRAAIVQLGFWPGDPLSEAEIARQLGVSRQPVREAFIKLGEAGLVEIRPQRGTFVRLISLREVETARFLREAIEVAIVRKAAETPFDTDIAAMKHLVEEQRVLLGVGDNVAFLRSDEMFHQAIAASANCEDAWRVLEGLKAQMDRVRYLSLPDATPIQVIIGQHESIIAGIAAHSPGQAERAMREHLTEILISLPQLAREKPAYFEV